MGKGGKAMNAFDIAVSLLRTWLFRYERQSYQSRDKTTGMTEHEILYTDLPIWAADDNAVNPALGRLGNIRFRICHDTCHRLTGLGFDIASERKVNAFMIEHIKANLWPLIRLSPEVEALIRAETDGFIDYFEQHGKFPDCQLTFVKDEWKRQLALVRSR
jgi:hypothetical protein